MARLGARQLIERVIDAGSYRSWDEPPIAPFAVHGELDPGYAAELAAARQRTGLDEAVITGEARLGGHLVAVAACEFDFLAGSIGVAAAERLVRAVERATARRLPLLASPTSGGTRMQEGAVAFAQMVTIAGAVARHRARGLPYLAYLRDPTMGGVFASWGSLAHVTTAEPGALIGFLGPRVYQAIHGEPFPEGVQTAENLHAHGLIDAVVAPEALRRLAITALDVLTAPRAPSRARAAPPVESVADVPAWESVRRSRRPDRPGVRELLTACARRVTTLHGTGEGEQDSGMRLALATFDDVPCVLLGQDRRAARPLGPAGLRVARRGMRLAAELRLPLLTVVDTAGAATSVEAEQGGLAGEIARCVAELATLRTHTVCLLLGQGAGGGALALLPADRVLAAQHGWLAPLPPEGASVIRHRTTERAAELATAQGVRSLDLLRHGVVDRIVPELPDAADEPAAFLARLRRALAVELVAPHDRDPDDPLATRSARFRRLGRS